VENKKTSEKTHSNSKVQSSLEEIFVSGGSERAKNSHTLLL